MTEPASISRRRLIAGLGGIATAATLGACTSRAGSSTALKFWNMPWGGVSFNPTDKKITEAYSPKSGLAAATYQSVQWANFTTTFASAVASNTGPAVSSGGGTQAFQFGEQKQIAYADDLLASWKTNNLRRPSPRARRHDEDPGRVCRHSLQPRHARALAPQVTAREGRGRATDRLAVLPRCIRRPEEEGHLRLRHLFGTGGQRLPNSHRPDDQQRRRSLRCRPEAQLCDR